MCVCPLPTSPQGALGASPARVSLLPLSEDGIRERWGWGAEVEGVVRQRLQGAA